MENKGKETKLGMIFKLVQSGSYITEGKILASGDTRRQAGSSTYQIQCPQSTAEGVKHSEK